MSLLYLLYSIFTTIDNKSLSFGVLPDMGCFHEKEVQHLEMRIRPAPCPMHCSNEHAVFNKLYFTLKIVGTTITLCSTELQTEPIAP